MKIPAWAHPRAPIVANSLREGTIWDDRIERFTQSVLNFLRCNALSALLIFFALGAWAGGHIGVGLGLLILSPILIIPAELLYLRVWLNLPLRTSELIAGEQQRQTWDIIRATALPRYQLVLGKFMAIWWVSRSTMLFVMLLRVLLFGGLVVARGVEKNSTVPQYLLGWLVWMMCLILMPLLEFYAIAAIGTFISANHSNVQAARLMTLLSQMGYRLLGVALILALVPSLAIVPSVILFPQWVLVPFGGQLGMDYSRSLVAALSLVWLVLPIGVGSAMLWFTYQKVENG